MASTVLDHSQEYDRAYYEARMAIERYREAGERYAALCGREMDLEADRPAKKLAAIRRILGTENPLTQRPHSASSAAAVCETDMEYRAHLALQSDIVVEKNHAKVEAVAARLTADLALARVRIEGGLR